MDLLDELITASKSQVISRKPEEKYKKRGSKRQAPKVEVRERKVLKTEPPKSSTVALLEAAEVVRRLRERNEPATLFGETNMDRYQRLRTLEASGSGVIDERRVVPVLDDEEEEDIVVSVALKIIKFIRRMLDEWQVSLEGRADESKRSAIGRRDTATFTQCKEHIRPFLKLLKKNVIGEQILNHVSAIVDLCEKREYIQAADWYVKLAIGNAAWPIGVTMVGIHERTGRERINASNMAHVMNDEAQRKYITSIKRIMTFCQSRYPTDPSKCLQ